MADRLAEIEARVKDRYVGVGWCVFFGGKPAEDLLWLIAEGWRARRLEEERDAERAKVRRMEDDLYLLRFGLGSAIEGLSGMREALAERYSKCGPDYSAVTRAAASMAAPTCPDCETALAEHETPAARDAAIEEVLNRRLMPCWRGNVRSEDPPAYTGHTVIHDTLPSEEG